MILEEFRLQLKYWIDQWGLLWSQRNPVLGAPVWDLASCLGRESERRREEEKKDREENE